MKSAATAFISSVDGSARTGTKPIAISQGMREVLALAEDVAQTPTTVLLVGENGTGKEVMARYIHERSPRANKPYVAVNCAALPRELLESELFGHERGAFTGANERRLGRFEQAQGGTLLLDEISELPLPLQAKLLRVLQERQVDRVGGTKPIPVDVRVMATSNRNLAHMVEKGELREDLFYRLNVYPIHLPALRERREDLVPLCTHILSDLASAMGRQPPTLSEEASSLLFAHAFPGNVRELRNVLERALIRCREDVISSEHLSLSGLQQRRPIHAAAVPSPQEHTQTGFPAEFPLELAALERLAIAEALRRSDGNRTHAARLLGIGLRTLRAKLNDPIRGLAPRTEPNAMAAVSPRSVS